jgi:hypothetical protein
MDDQIFQIGMFVAYLTDGYDGPRHASVAVAVVVQQKTADSRMN